MSPAQKLKMPRSWEYIIPLSASLSLLLSCILISPNKYFWNDELLSFYLLDDASFRHMIAALTDKINNAPPLYFTLGWIWAKLFTSSEVSLRLFSSVAICVALTLTWVTLRRSYDFPTASIATLAVFCLSHIILQQNTEARFYGLFLAVCSLGLMHYDGLCRRDTLSSWVLLSAAFVHAAIIQTHLFGFLYSGAILCALIVRDKLCGLWRPTLYLSIILGWLSFVPWIMPFLVQADLANPRSWIPLPTIDALINIFRLHRYFFFILLTISGIIFLNNVMLRCIGEGNRAKNIDQGEEGFERTRIEMSLLIVAFCLLAVPVGAWIISRTVQPIFVARYMLPAELGWAIILACLVSRMTRPNSIVCTVLTTQLWTYKSLVYAQRIILITLLLFLVVQPINYGRKFGHEELPGVNDDIAGHSELPVAVEFSHAFMRRFHYSPQRARYHFILDWPAAVVDGSGLFMPGEYKTMEALRRTYGHVFAKNIVESDEFLRRHKRFLVLQYADPCSARDVVCPRWSAIRIMNNPRYSMEKVGSVDGMDVILVERKE